MRTNVERVFAAGDCSTFPLSDSGLRAKVQHWAMAHSQGKIAYISENEDLHFRHSNVVLKDYKDYVFLGHFYSTVIQLVPLSYKCF